MIRGGLRVGAVTLLLVMMLSGCGGGGASGGSGQATASGVRSIVSQVDNWFNGVKPGTTQIDQAGFDVTRFTVRRPPPVDDLLLRIPGVRAGRAADSSAQQMEQATTLTKAEVKRLYCYFSSWYVKNGTLPTDRQGFEEALFGYLRGRVLRSTPPEQMWGIAELFRDSIIKAQNEGEAAARIAVATVCTVPSQ